MQFKYLRDPVFAVCVLLYLIGRALRSLGVHHPLFDGYFNDLLCAGFWVPITVALLRLAGLRRHDARPTGIEVAVCLGVWAVMYEAVFPATAWLSGRTVADPFDVTAYALGGFVAVLAWRFLYPQSARTDGCVTGRSRSRSGCARA